jgi:hypothetical protein
MGAFLVRVLTTCALFATVAAQEVPPEVTIIQLAPGGQPVPVPAAPAAAAAKAADAAPKTPEEKRLAELLKLKFDRSAASILQAQTTLAEKAPADNPAELFRLQIVAGRWAEAGPFLKTLPAADATKVYDYMLKDLDRLPTSGTTPSQQQQQGPTLSPTLLLDDVLRSATSLPPRSVTINSSFSARSSPARWREPTISTRSCAGSNPAPHGLGVRIQAIASVPRSFCSTPAAPRRR